MSPSGRVPVRATAIVPVKRFDAAKRRLSDALPDGPRAALAAAMLADVLRAIVRSAAVGETIVVSGEPTVATIVEEVGAILLDDPEDAGHSRAAALGVEAALLAGAEVAAVLPGDCPLLDPGELDRAIAQAPPASVGVIPDRHRTGTNGLILRPPDAIEPSFGPGSCERHLRMAADRGLAAAVLALPSLALDLDTAEDLEALRSALGSRPEPAPATAAALIAPADSQRRRD